MRSLFASKDKSIQLTISTASGVKCLAAGDDRMVIGGHGAVYYDGTPGTEYTYWGTALRLRQGCLDAAVKEDDVRCFFNHDENWLLGRTASSTMRLSLDSKGVMYETDINPDDSQGRDVYAKVKRGDCTGSSMMFLITDSEIATENGKNIEWVTGIRPLMEMGPVVFPAMTSANSVALSERGHAEYQRRVEESQRQIALAEKRRRERRLRLTEI